jgi:hypothetical protein
MHKNVTAEQLIEKSPQYKIKTYDDFAEQRLQKKMVKVEKEMVQGPVAAAVVNDPSPLLSNVVTAICSIALTALVIKKFNL